MCQECVHTVGMISVGAAVVVPFVGMAKDKIIKGVKKICGCGKEECECELNKKIEEEQE